PTDALDPARRRQVDALDAEIPALVELLVSHRPDSLGGVALGPALTLADRRPADLTAHFDAWRAGRARLRDAAPALAFAVLGQGRAQGRLAPEEESRTVGNLLTYWALRNTLDLAELCATPAPARRGHELQPA